MFEIEIRNEALNEAVEIMNCPFTKKCYASHYNFVLGCRTHLGERGSERSGIYFVDFWLRRVEELLREVPSTFKVASRMHSFPVMLIDSDEEVAFFCNVKPVRINGIMVFTVYVKTMINIGIRVAENKPVFANTGDCVLEISINKHTVDVDPTWVQRKNR